LFLRRFLRSCHSIVNRFATPNHFLGDDAQPSYISIPAAADSSRACGQRMLPVDGYGQTLRAILAMAGATQHGTSLCGGNITPFGVVRPLPSQSDARWQSRSSRAKISVSGIFSTSARRLITSALSVVPRLRLNVATPRESPVTTVCRSLATALSKVLHERHPTKSPMQLDWTCRTSIVRQQLVRAKLIWESSTSYSTCPRMLFAIVSGLSFKFCCTSIKASWTAFLRTLAGANSKFCFWIAMSRATDSARRIWRGRTIRSFDSSC
jgi:hypothetical protein